MVQRRTRRKKLRGAVGRFSEWIQTHRHGQVSEWMKTVAAKYAGHWNYYGVIGNSASLSRYCRETSRILFKWLNRRSQRRSDTWRAFHRLLQRFEVPPPRVMETVAGIRRGPCHAVGWVEPISQVNLFGPAYRAAGA